MAREYLYKAKRKDNGEWVFGDYTQYAFTGKPCICGADFFAEIIPETICEYTGLKDKNGKQVFEHDIVTTKYGRLCEFVWLNVPSFCGYDLKPLESKHPCPTAHDLYYYCNLEVVGNKFDNDLEVQDELSN